MSDAGATQGLQADLVLEGGGVKGIAFAGAVTTFAEAGYSFPRVAGSSAGAIAGAVIAALQQAGEPLSRSADVVRTLDHARLRDRGPIARYAGPLGPLVDLASLVVETGVYEGEVLRDWIAGVLRDLGVERFGDLRLPPDAGADLDDSHRYSLVVTASDVSRKRLVLLPWHYGDYGLDPDDQLVADAVRASASIPFYFEPVTLRARGRGVSTLVDGAVLSDYPISVFDRTDGKPPRWPTFGVRLSAREGARSQVEPVRGPVSLALAVVGTMLEASDAVHISQECVRARSVFVDTSGISPIDFDISDEQQERLLQSGRAGARKFLASWDFGRYVDVCRGGAP
ncbi:MAG: patatin-like phospholipase family protein [Streptomycetales bacterium]